SFGGGSATLMLIRREVVERKGWVEAEAFTRDWSLCQATPGINLLGITLLVGWRLRGWIGGIAALLGLLVPSVLITILLTATYATYRDSPVLAAALKGIVPATVGLGLLNAVQMAHPLLKLSGTEGRGSLMLSIVLLVGAGVVSLFHVPVALVLAGAAGIGALAHWHLPLRAMAKAEVAD
ncbi:MAG: chromate transporter, partial [Acetobacteraceae bacterium]